MPSNYTIMDNFLSKEDFDKVQSALGINTDNFKFPWYYLGKVDDGTLPEIDDHLMFTHMIFAGVQIFSEHYHDILPIVDKINLKALIRIKVNAYPKNGNKIIHHRQHVDYPYEHKGAIFYLNTNNGLTVLEDGTEIASVANRMLFFDAHKPHNSTNATDVKMRYNINFNYF